MTSIEVNFHDVAKAEIRRSSNPASTCFWATIILYDGAGQQVGEVCLFSNGSWPVPIVELS